MNKRNVVSRMIHSLLNQAKKKGVSLRGLTTDNFNWFLDSAFDDGGEVRCIHFTDLADPYARRYGPLESEGWDKARWECIELAIQGIQEAVGK